MNTSAQAFLQDVLWAIRQERQATPNSLYLVISEITPHRNGVQVRLESPQGDDEDDAVVDERFRNAHVHGEGFRSINGKQITAQLDPNLDDLIVLVWADIHSVHIGQIIEIRAYDFFVPLLNAWISDTAWVDKAYERFIQLSDPQKVSSVELGVTSMAKHLTPTQAGVLQLVQMSASFSIGPAGTGKTETSAVTLAAYLRAKPDAKILLVGIANFAVDQLLERLDELLKQYGRNDLRQQVTRYGSGVGTHIRHQYAHLLPGTSDAFLPGYANRENARFDEELSGFDPEQKQTRLFAMTVATAIQKIESLRGLAPFDFCLVEEASQASLVQLLPLAAVSESILFAGDPAQLSPVAKYRDPKVRQWMAASPFSRMPGMSSEAVWMLTEQRRMADPICRLVSNIAYSANPLVTAPDALGSRTWMASRYGAFGRYGPERHVILHDVREVHAVHGAVRKRLESIEEIITLLHESGSGRFLCKDVMVITPFRDQARLIKHALTNAGFGEVNVSTVHRTQGSAKKVVIFDVVDGRNPFLQTEEATRLLTVAFSRAEAKLLILASSRDLAHPILRLAQATAMQEIVTLDGMSDRENIAA